MKSVKLSKRMQMVAQTVSCGKRVADIGCDHAYTSIYMVQNNIATNVIAMDINKGPLEKAKKNITYFECDDYIETRLSDGATLLKENEVDSIVIAGMGGKLIKKILSDSRDVVEKCDELILQPQSELFLVREYIYELGFFIIEEKALKEDGKFYFIIKASKKKFEEKKYSEVENLYGRYLLKNKNEILKEFLDKEKIACEKVLEHMKEKQLNEEGKERKEEIQHKYDNIKKGIFTIKSEL